MSVNLAVSIHAANDALRSRLVPLNRRYPLADLIAACRAYIAQTGRRLTYEYALIAGENDALEHAHELAALLKGQLCHVNLIPLNPIPGTRLRAARREQVRAFAQVLTDAHIPCTVRIERGQDIAAACGQLKIAHEPGSHQRSLNPAVVTKDWEEWFAARSVHLRPSPSSTPSPASAAIWRWGRCWTPGCRWPC